MGASAESKARWLFAGFLLLAAAAAGGWWLVDAARYATYEIRTRDAVSGLIPGAPVEFHGVEVGKVRAVQLVDPRLVRVLLEVRRDAPVSAATVATITGRGLAARGFTGYVYVSLEDSGSSGQPLARSPDSPYPLLASAPARLVNLDTSIQALNGSVQAVSGLLQSALDPATQASLKQSLASLDQVTRTLAAHDDQLSRVIANAEQASRQVQPLLQAGGEAARTLQAQVLPQAQDTLVRLDRLSSTLDGRLGTILQNTEEASLQLEPLLRASTATVQVLQTQVLPQTQRTLARLDQAATSLGETAVRVRRDPSLLLRGANAVPPGPGEAP